MRIKKKLWQHRRDFEAIYECEHCGYTEKRGGYDDKNFHENVIPEMVCPRCGKKAPFDYKPMKTVFPEGFQV